MTTVGARNRRKATKKILKKRYFRFFPIPGKFIPFFIYKKTFKNIARIREPKICNLQKDKNPQSLD